MTALYQIAYEYQQAFNDLSSNDELSTEIITDTLSGIEAEFEQKALAVGGMILNLEADERAIEDAILKMNERRIKIQKKLESMRKYLMCNLNALNKVTIKSAEFDIFIKKCPAHVDILPGTILDPEFLRIPEIKPMPDKTALKEALQHGREIKGVSLVHDQRLEIR